MSEEAKQPRKKKGRVVRLSKEVETYLSRKRKGSESFDSILRRVFGLPDRKGNEQPLKTYYVIDNGGKSPIIKRDKAEAKGEAIILAVRKDSKKTERVLTVREVP